MAENLQTEKQKTIDINVIQILGYRVITFPIENRAIGIDYATGYNSNGQFVPVEKGFKQLQGEEFDALVSANPDPTVSFYENIKRALYALI